MALVDYSESGSSSSNDEEANSPLQAHCRKRKNGNDDTTQSESVRAKRKRSSVDNSSTTTTTTAQPKTTPPPPIPPSSLLPSLPSTFHSLYATSVRSSTLDDPTLHSGRIRQTPHIEGNWPTHIYLEWYPSATELTHLTHLISSIKSTNPRLPAHEHPQIHTLLSTPLGAQLPLHISLSAPLTLQTDQKPLFLDSLTQAITISTVKPFTVTTGDTVDWVPNFDSTRWFLVLRISRPEGDGLNRLSRVCNEVVREFGGPLLYGEVGVAEEQSVNLRSRPRKSRKDAATAREDAANAGLPDRSDCFHFSIAWTLQDPRRGGSDENMVELTELTSKDMEISFDVVKVKIGNVVHVIPLARSTTR